MFVKRRVTYMQKKTHTHENTSCFSVRGDIFRIQEKLLQSQQVQDQFGAQSGTSSLEFSSSPAPAADDPSGFREASLGGACWDHTCTEASLEVRQVNHRPAFIASHLNSPFFCFPLLRFGPSTFFTTTSFNLYRALIGQREYDQSAAQLEVKTATVAAT